jgi:hypothetical protein
MAIFTARTESDVRVQVQAGACRDTVDTLQYKKYIKRFPDQEDAF